jgi:hypothetical protein
MLCLRSYLFTRNNEFKGVNKLDQLTSIYMIICIFSPCCFFLVIVLVFSNLYKLSVISYTCRLPEINA